MPAHKNELTDRLARYREIKITVTGRKSGRAISIPVWFVLHDNKVLLLPVQGSDTQWYKNVLQNSAIGIEAQGVEGKFHAVPTTKGPQVDDVIKKFREKYSVADVKKYYSKLDVAVLVELR